MTVVCTSDISAQCIINNLCLAFPDSVCHTNTTDRDRVSKISGLWHDVDGAFAVLVCYIVFVGSFFVKGQGGRGEFFLHWLTLEHGTFSLSQNVAKQL
jgi:hypothetical protein